MGLEEMRGRGDEGTKRRRDEGSENKNSCHSLAKKPWCDLVNSLRAPSWFYLYHERMCPLPQRNTKGFHKVAQRNVETRKTKRRGDEGTKL